MQREVFRSTNGESVLTCDDASGVLTVRVSAPANNSGGADLFLTDERALLELLQQRERERMDADFERLIALVAQED